MQQPFHALTKPGARWTTERFIGVGFVGVIHVIAITAILTGLTPTITRIFERPINLIPVKTVRPPPDNTVVRVKDRDLPTLPQPVNVREPRFKIAPEKLDQIPGSDAKEIEQQPQPPVTDTNASGVSGTHTIPDYPSLARRLSEQGSVRLSLTISPDGSVIAANVAQSSGFPDLDDAAVNWVLGHWKYKPATHLGAAVASQIQAVVVFNLKNIR
jgi:protein TonB